MLSGCASAIGVKLTADVVCATETGESIGARYYELSDGSLSFVKLRLPRGQQATLPNVMSASGAKYSDDRHYIWWTKGNTAFLEERSRDGKWKVRYEQCKLVPP